MSDKKEKNISKRRKRRYKKRVKSSVKITLLVILVVSVIGSYAGIKVYQLKNAVNPYGDVDSANITEEDDGEILLDGEKATYRVLDVDDGEAILISFGTTEVLIDTGSSKGSVKLGKELKGKIVGTLDYLILTSPDERRVGGLKLVADSYKIGTTIYAPSIEDSSEIRSIAWKASEWLVPAKSTSYDLGEDATLSLLLPKVSSDDPADKSVITYFTLGDVGCLSLSDAGKEEVSRAMEGVGDVSLLVLGKFGDLKIYNLVEGLKSVRECVLSTDKDVSPELAEACRDLIVTKDGTAEFSVSSEEGVTYIVRDEGEADTKDAAEDEAGEEDSSEEMDPID